MREPIQIGAAQLWLGDCREVLAGLAAGSVHCCISSPPYWGLRDYGIEPSVWGGQAGCRHEWGGQGRSPSRNRNKAPGGIHEDRKEGSAPVMLHPKTGAFCQKCGAWRGCLGLEPTPDLYVQHLVQVLREVRRVLRDDATLWLNLGDCYASGHSECAYLPPDSPLRPPQRKSGARGGMKARDHLGTPPRSAHGGEGEYVCKRGFSVQPPGLKPKDLCMMSSRVAMALQADGWYLRSQIPWLKRNAMPESTRDRPATAVEYVFLLTLSARYYYDAEAVRVEGAGYGRSTGGFRGEGPHTNNQAFDNSAPVKGNTQGHTYQGGRFRRNSDWFWESWQGLYDEGDGPLGLIVNPAAFRAAHFATFPPGLVEPCLKAGTSEKGCCPACGAPWRRVVDRKSKWPERKAAGEPMRYCTNNEVPALNDLTGTSRTLGWQPTCRCDSALRTPHSALPCTVLDPFAGAGTVALVANRLGRRSIGIEVKPEYVEMAAERLRKDSRPATHVSRGEVALPLFPQEALP